MAARELLYICRNLLAIVVYINGQPGAPLCTLWRIRNGGDAPPKEGTDPNKLYISGKRINGK